MGLIADWAFSTDTPDCALGASGGALESCPSQWGKSVGSPLDLLRALFNATIVKKIFIPLTHKELQNTLGEEHLVSSVIVCKDKDFIQLNP